MSLKFALLALVVLMVGIISTVASHKSHHSCHCEKDGDHRMLHCEQYCCKEEKGKCHCCEDNKEGDDDDDDDDDHHGHHRRHKLAIYLSTAGIVLLLFTICGCACCYKYKHRKTSKCSKVMPTESSSGIMVAVVSNEKEKEALGLDSKGFSPQAYPVLAFGQAPPSYSQIDLRATVQGEPSNPPDYASLTKEKI